MIRYVEGNIRITKVPDGEAPLQVREKWVDLVLHVVAVSSGDCRGILSGTKVNNGLHYTVPKDLAIAALDQQHHDAADWWKNNSPATEGSALAFYVDEAEVVGELKNIVPKEVRQFVELSEVLGAGVSVHDHPANN